VSGRRGDAIRAAVHDQLGLEVLEIKPVGLEASGGSTPLRMRVIDEETGQERWAFAKLYARSHVRADRWYKLGRTMLYGSLEDETPFGTVRRFVEYEDYALRLLGAYGFSTPQALGVAEITPEREYLIAMEFFDGAVEIGEAEVTEHIVDEGLQMIRRMWDVGLAHRDIKPANLMVRDDELKVIDVFFVQVRPSPWRQAVDLANMMLVLALRSDAETVYERALHYFTPDELGEAFAAARGVASPTQLRNELKEDGRDLLAKFRAMAPARPPIGVQRWSAKRVLLILGALLLATVTVQTSIGLFFPNNDTVASPGCDGSRELILIAQAVPTAEHLPCVRDLPLGWTANPVSVRQGRVVIGLTPLPGTGTPAVTVTLTHDCDPVLGGQQIDTGGGCVTYVSTLRPSDEVPTFTGRGLGLVPRTDLVTQVDNEEDLPLCGAEVPCP
jgi:tRNA A-37 threonylcarbamoyl transferase component Bud32